MRAREVGLRTQTAGPVYGGDGSDRNRVPRGKRRIFTPARVIHTRRYRDSIADLPIRRWIHASDRNAPPGPGHPRPARTEPGRSPPARTEPGRPRLARADRRGIAYRIGHAEGRVRLAAASASGGRAGFRQSGARLAIRSSRGGSGRCRRATGARRGRRSGGFRRNGGGQARGVGGPRGRPAHDLRAGTGHHGGGTASDARERARRPGARRPRLPRSVPALGTAARADVPGPAATGQAHAAALEATG